MRVRISRDRFLVAGLALHLLALAPPSPLAAQAGTVAGSVTDLVSSRPVADARVYVPDTRFTTYTNEEGTYVLAGVPAGAVELRVERPGYQPEARELLVPAEQTVTADFELVVAAVAVDALVVTATGPQRRRELGNAASTIPVDEALRHASPPSLSSLLQGRAPGVQVLLSSGTVGASSGIRIRGNGSISLDDTPLVYIDGSRVSNDVRSGPAVGGQSTSRLSDLRLEDIESIEIVKGPSATTLYGAEASAGVIRITTKRGRPGTAEWSLYSEVGALWDDTDWPITVWSPRSFFPELVDVSELLEPGDLPEGQYYGFVADTLYALDLLDGGDGYASPWRTGIGQTYGASLRGGSESITYFLSGEFSDQQGALPNNESLQRGLRANFDLLPYRTLDLAVSASYSNNRVMLPDNDNSAYGYIGVGLLGAPWGVSITRTDLRDGETYPTCPLAWEIQRALATAGSALADAGEAAGLPALTEENCPRNAYYSERSFDDIATLRNTQDVERITASLETSYRPTGFLTARGTVGYDQFTDQTGFLVPVDPDLPFADDSRGVRGIDDQLFRVLTLEANLSAVLEITPDLRATTSAGFQFVRQKAEVTSAVGRALPPGSGIVSGAVRTIGGESVGETRTLGLFVQEQLDWRDRLFLTPAIRFDDSSAFGQNLGREAYPRIMVSYVLSEEPWFADLVPARVVSSLRLRGAWGVSGKQPAAFAALKLVSPRRVTFRGEDVPGFAFSTPGNPELEPERAEEIELGFEADLFTGRLGIDFTWFRQITRDAIVPRPLPPSTGYAAGTFANIGEIRNRGIELGLSALVMNSRGVRWSWQLNLARIRGEITDLDEPIVFGLGGETQRHQEGYPFGSYFSRTYVVDRNGEVIASDSAVWVGQPTPQVEGSLSTTIDLSDWVSLSASLGFATGFQQFNSTEEFRCGFFGGGRYGGVCPELFQRGLDGEPSYNAKIKAQAARDLEVFPWIEDASFARLRTVSARFEVPRGWVARVGATRASFTVTAENLLLITGYTGIDPEVNFAGGSQSLRGEFFTLPPAKRVTGRLTLTF